MSPQIWGYAALEIVPDSLKLKNLGANWKPESESPRPGSQASEITYVKLSGSPSNRCRLRSRAFLLDSFFGEGEYGEDSLRGAKLIWFQQINPVLVLSFSFEEDEAEKARRYKRLRSTTIKTLVQELLPGARISESDSVYTVIGTVGPATADWPEGIKSGWAHIHGSRDGYLDSEVMRQVVTDIAIEKSLLNRIGHYPWQGLRSIFSAPKAAGLVRRLPVQGLPDWGKIAVLRAELRASRNFDAFRNEVLEASRHWWSVVGIYSGLLALVAGLTTL